MEGAGSSDSEKKSVCDIIPFVDFANLLEKISNVTGKDRIAKLSRYFTHYRQKYAELHGTMNAEVVNNGDSIFSLVRLLLPSYDRTRAAYNIKATVLARMYGKILGLSPQSADGNKLIGFKDPGKAGSAAGDLATIVYTVLEKRFSFVARTGPKLSELHKVLDQLARTKGTDADPVTQETQIKILQNFFRRLSPVEGKWLTRIILKVVKMDMSHTQILKLVHPCAKDLLKTMSLEQICIKLNDPATVISETEGSIVLFNYFRPMLCLRLNSLDDEIPNSQSKSPGQNKSSPRKKDQIVLPAPPFIVETKWDGERFQIHYEFNASTGIQTFKYFSRQGFDFTTNFEATLSERLKEQIVKDPPVESFILDGEMMAWQKDKKIFTQKGGSIDVKRMVPENVNHCPVFVAFDIVYYNGEDLVGKPLIERMKIMTQVLIPKDSVCQLSEQTIVHSKSAVEDALNDAIDKLEEGLVVKSLDSVYQPGERPPTWLKIKPEYIEGSSVSDMDLLILGAYYTDSVRRGGKLTHLLAGLVQNNEFYPLVKLGSGSLRKPEMEALVSALQPYLVKSEIPGVKFGGRNRPDLFIDPKKSIVVQVKATEIIYSKEYELNYTLRFARITQVRRDKNWDDTMSVKDFHQLRVSCEGKLAKRTDGLGRFYDKKKNKSSDDKRLSDSDPEEPGPSIAGKGKISPKKPGSPYKIRIALSGGPLKKSSTAKSDVFNSKVFNVVGSPLWKENMEHKLRTHGAEIVQNPTNDMLCVIAEKFSSRRVQIVITDGRYDIVKDSWVDRCILAKQVIPFQPDYMLFAKEETKSAFGQDYDEFGDSYTIKSSRPELEELIGAMIQKIKQESTPTPQEMKTIKREIDEEVFPVDAKLRKFSFLSECKIAFRGKVDYLLSSQIEFFGGTVVEDELEGGVTHVILGEPPSPRKRQHIDAFVVKRRWLRDCLDKKEVLSELPYTVE